MNPVGMGRKILGLVVHVSVPRGYDMHGADSHGIYVKSKKDARYYGSSRPISEKEIRNFLSAAYGPKVASKTLATMKKTTKAHDNCDE